MATPDQRQVLNGALNDWVQGQRDAALSRVAPLAASGHLPAVVMALWFLAQLGNWQDAAPYVRTTVDAGLAFPGLWFAGNYATSNNEEHARLLLDTAQNLANGAPATDLVGQWNVLWNAGHADAALRVFEVAADPVPGARKAEWDKLVEDARGFVSEVQSAGATIVATRDSTLESMREANAAVETEATRVRTLVDETTSFVHGLTAGEMANAYTEKANNTQGAARFWTCAAILLGLGAATWAGVIANDAYSKGGQTVPEIVAKSLLSVSVLVVAGYLAQIAATSRRMSWHWAHVALQIRTAEPYIGNLEKNTRERLLAALAVRLFPGQSLDPQSAMGHTQENLDVGALLAAVLGETDHPTLPPVMDEVTEA